MAYTASALTRTGTSTGRWSGEDLDLAGLEDLDGLVDLLREHSDGDATTLLFLDEDDEYLAIVRVGEDEDARMFVSDRRALDGPGLAGRLLGDDVITEAVDVDPDEDEEDSGRPEVEPGGDATMLTDLGVDSATLLQLCAEEGMLPSDVIFAVCERIGCSEVLEQVRGV